MAQRALRNTTAGEWWDTMPPRDARHEEQPESAAAMWVRGALYMGLAVLGVIVFDWIFPYVAGDGTAQATSPRQLAGTWVGTLEPAATAAAPRQPFKVTVQLDEQGTGDFQDDETQCAIKLAWKGPADAGKAEFDFQVPAQARCRTGLGDFDAASAKLRAWQAGEGKLAVEVAGQAGVVVTGTLTAR